MTNETLLYIQELQKEIIKKNKEIADLKLKLKNKTFKAKVNNWWEDSGRSKQ